MLERTGVNLDHILGRRAAQLSDAMSEELVRLAINNKPLDEIVTKMTEDLD